MHVRFRHKLLGGHRHVRVFIGQSPNHTLALSGTLVLDSSERRWGKAHYTNTDADAVARDQWIALRDALATAPGITFDEIDETEE